MSNVRRHELEHNELAQLLDRANKKVAPYAKLIGFGLIAIAIAAIAWLLYSYRQTGQRSDATLELIQASASQDAEVLREVSERYPGTAAAAWAKLYQGQLELSQGIGALYRDPIEANELLTSAKSALGEAIAASSDPLLQSRAHLALGRAEESLGNFDEAMVAYQQVTAIGESDAIIEQAEERIAALSEPETKEFVAWFEDQDFAPADPSLPPSLDGVETLPDDPDMPLLELQSDLLTGDDDAESKPAEQSETSAAEDSSGESEEANQEVPEDAEEPTAEQPADTEPADTEPDPEVEEGE